MAFGRDEEVEVCSKEEGFWGSYYAAKVVSYLQGNDLYVVEYKDLVDENDQSRLLIESVPANEVRPVPPKIVASGFRYLDMVDAFDNDGWWVGKISAIKYGGSGSEDDENYYYVFFETTGDEIAYPLSRLRGHLDWHRGKWVSSIASSPKPKRTRIC